MGLGILLVGQAAMAYVTVQCHKVHIEYIRGDLISVKQSITRANERINFLERAGEYHG